MAPFLVLKNLHKSFGDHVVLDGISLGVEEGEILVLLGPSGSGKTTLLRLIGGFESPDEGSIEVADEDVTRLAPAKRNFGMVFQHYALFPHLSVGENVGFGLESRGVPEVKIRDQVIRILPLVDLDGFEERRIHEISGGQQQRVALARALAPNPRVLLLDEPLSNLDPTLRQRTRRQLKSTIASIGITAVWVTHEQEEAFDVGDRVALLNDGKLEQIGPPEELYLQPRSRFVAGFVGRASHLAGVVQDADLVRIGGDEGRPSVALTGVGTGNLTIGTRVDVVFRPEGLQLLPPDIPGGLGGRIVHRSYGGETTLYEVELDVGGRVLVSGEVRAGRAGERVGVAFREGGPPPSVFVDESAGPGDPRDGARHASAEERE